jgi:chaperonin GroEL (HSP60 family)
MRPFAELCSNTNNSKYKLLQELNKLGYPYAYDFLKNKYIHTMKEGLIDSAKSIRSILWNALTIISTLITSD